MALTLAVLGPLDVRFAQAAVALPAKAQALLVYLAFADRPVRREVLADMFWGDTGEGGARANLRLALSRLRQVLPGVIHADTQSVSLQAEQVGEVDAITLLRAATLTPRPSAQALQEAIAGYRGTFLQDFVLRDCPVFEDWAAAQRMRIDRHAVVVLRELAQTARERGDVLALRHCLERWADIEAWNEEAVLPLVQLLADGGAHALAMDRFEACQRALAEEQGARPSNGLMALVARVRQGPVSGLPSLPMALAGAGPATAPADLAQPAPAVPAESTDLFGRAQDIGLIHEKLAQGERLIMLLGPAGVGKSRLARAVARDMESRYADGVVNCSFDFLEPGASSEAGRDHFIATLGTTLGLDFSQTVQPVALLMAHLRTRRAILCLDGLEACEAAAPVIGQVLEAAPHCLLLVTSRVWLPLMAGWSHELAGLNTDCAGAAQAPAVDMLLACVRAAGARLDGGADPAQLARLTRLLDGSPLAIQFAAQSLRLYTPAQLADRLDAGGWPDAPRNLPGYRHQSLSDVMADAWSQLSLDLQHAWARCALFHGTFALAWARECAGVHEQAMAALRDRFILGSEPGGRLRMHELTRRYGLAMLDRMVDAQAIRRGFADAALARLVSLLPALQNEDAAVVDLLKPEISTLASAFDIALQWRDPPQLHAPLHALWRAYHRLGWQYAAVNLLESTLARHAQAVPDWLIPWHQMAGEASRSLYGYQRADVHFKKAVQLGGMRLVRGRWKPWMACLRAGVQALVARPKPADVQRNAQRMLAHSIAAMLPPRYLNGSPLPELLAGVAAAWLAARRSGATDARLVVMLRLLRFLPTDLPSAWVSRLMQAVRPALKDVDPVQQAYAMKELGLIMVNYGGWADASLHLHRASLSLAALGDGYHALECLSEHHSAQLHQGDFVTALVDVATTEARARQMNQPSILRWALLLRLQLWMRTGNGSAEDIQACLTEIHAIPAYRSPVEELSVRGHESLLAGRMGRRDDVLGHAPAVLQLARRVGSGRFHALATLQLTLDAVMVLAFEPAADAQCRDLAVALSGRFMELARHMGIFSARCLLYAGQVAVLQGRRAEAVQAWRKGLVKAKQNALRYDEARLQWMLSLYLQGEEAQACASSAAAQFVACGVNSPYPFVPAKPK